MRITAAISAILFFLFGAFQVSAAENQKTLTQRDWIVNLIDTLGYSFGLPDTPQDSDYIKLLEGGRVFRFEAETFRNPDDLVAINNFSTFGEFSGTGWVSAISSPTKMRMNFLLPHAGTYQFFASVRLPGHTLQLDDQIWNIEENHPKFHRIDLGKTTLNAGMKELEIAMPANGSIDYIEFLAPPLPSIMPLTGWDPNTTLSYNDLAVSAIRALDLESLLPLNSEKILIEAETIMQDKSLITDQRHLGEPHGGFWLRTGASGGEVALPFNVEVAAVYTLSLVAEGAKIFTGSLDNHQPWQSEFPSYLKENIIGTWFLSSGQHQLKIVIPPRGGVDLLTLLQRQSATTDYRILAGLPAHDTVRVEDANRLLTLLARLNSRD